VPEEKPVSNLEIILEKTKCKACREERDKHLEKVNWDKFTDEQIEEQLVNIYCQKHRLSTILFACMTIEDVKARLLFHDKGSPLNYQECCTVHLPALVSMKSWKKKKDIAFTNQVVEYVLTAKGKMKKGFKPNILKKYMKGAPLTIEFWAQHKLDPKYFPICIENGYPYKESVEACFKKGEAKKLNSYIELIVTREEKKAETSHQQELTALRSQYDSQMSALQAMKQRLESEIDRYWYSNPDIFSRLQSHVLRDPWS